MATQSEKVAHAALVGGGETALHSHAGGGSAPDETLPTTPRTLVDDFVTQSTETGEVGMLNWSFTNGSMQATANAQNHPGIQTRRSGTTANQVASMYFGNAVGTTVLQFDEFDTMYWIIATVTTGSDFTMRAGLMNNVSTNPPTDGLYIERLSSDSGFYGVTRNGSSETRTAQLVANDVNFHTFRLRRVDASRVGFTVNGGGEVILDTNIMSASDNLNVGLQVIPTTTTARDIKLDFFSLKLLGVTR